MIEKPLNDEKDNLDEAEFFDYSLFSCNEVKKERKRKQKKAYYKKQLKLKKISLYSDEFQEKENDGYDKKSYFRKKCNQKIRRKKEFKRAAGKAVRRYKGYLSKGNEYKKCYRTQPAIPLLND